jgi:hypothetical protein
MKRTTVMLPEDVDMRLRLEARRRGVPVAQVARDAVDEHLALPQPERTLSFVAVSDAGPPDGSERVDEYVGESIRRELEQREA